MEVWTSSNIKKEVIESRNRIKGKYKASRITRNKYGVYILWIDKKSHDNIDCYGNLKNHIDNKQLQTFDVRR